MGNENSSEVLPLWVHPDPDKEYDRDLGPDILALAQTADTFLKPNPVFASEFKNIIVEGEAEIQNALQHDPRLSQWLPKLVPKMVSEEGFFQNYFSHVKAILVKARVIEKTGQDERSPSLTPASLDSSSAQARAASTPPSNISSSSSPSTTSSSSTSSAQSISRNENKHSHVVSNSILNSDTTVVTATVENGFLPSSPIPSPSDFQTQASLQPTKAIGWGIIARDSFRHYYGPAFNTAPGSRLVAVMFEDAARAKNFAQTQGEGIRYYTDAKSLLLDPEVDAVFIASVPGTRSKLALEVAKHGKACLIDAPMARNLNECRSIIDGFIRDKITDKKQSSLPLPLFVQYYRRCSPRFLLARHIIQNHLGTVTSVNVEYANSHHVSLSPQKLDWLIDAERSGGGLFMEVGSHTLDILDFLLGPLGHLKGDAVAIADNVQVESVVGLTFRCANDAVGTGSWNFVSQLNQDLLTIRGTHGRLTMSIFGDDAPLLHTHVEGQLVQFPYEKSDHVNEKFVHAIVGAIHRLRFQSSSDASSPQELLRIIDNDFYSFTAAARTAQLVDATLRSFYKSRQDNFWMRPGTWQKRSKNMIDQKQRK